LKKEKQNRKKNAPILTEKRERLRSRPGAVTSKGSRNNQQRKEMKKVQKATAS